MRSRLRVELLAAVLGTVVLGVGLAALAIARSPSESAKRPLARAGAAPVGCTPPSPGDHQVTVEPDRAPVLLHVPPGKPTGARQLMLVLPGAGMTGKSMEDYTGYDRLADQRGFVVAYPTAAGTRPFWNVSGTLPGLPDDVAYLRNVITALTGDAGCADRRHVGITGVSNGGGMSARMACDASDLLAAAAPVAGGYSTLPNCRPRRPLPILEIHGLRDVVVPYSGKAPDYAGSVSKYLAGWRARNACKTPARQSTPARNVVEYRWICADGRIIVHDRVTDAEHGWPGEDSLDGFSTTVRTWRFLSAFQDDPD